MRRVLLILIASQGLAMAQTWLMAPGKGSHQPSAPPGNVWTLVGTTVTPGTGSGAASPEGSVGDIVVVWTKWNGSGSVLTGFTEGNGATVTLRGTQVSHGSLDLYGRWATYTANSALTQGITPSWSGTPGFIDMMVWRLSVTGTVTYTNITNGTGTGTAVATGTFTTDTQNGIVLAGLGIYGAPAVSAMQVGGNAADNTYTLDVGRVWDYKHSSVLTSATATATMDSSFGWTASAFALSAQ